MTGTPPAGQVPGEPHGSVFRTELAADLTSARQARSAVRRALIAWGIDDPDGDAELLASELVANAAEHASSPIGLAIRHAQPDGQRGITCEITDASPGLRPSQARPYAERGRGLSIVTALAASSGVRAEPVGKTTWFTLVLTNRIDRTIAQAEADADAEAEAGA
jgi:anti-sigma regulatory factor (Ser/Thr protein kinase)